jgi:hypothetical protein
MDVEDFKLLDADFINPKEVLYYYCEIFIYILNNFAG